MNRIGWIFGGILTLALVGCQNRVDDVRGPVPEKFPPIPPLVQKAPAGLPIVAQPPTAFDTLVAQTVVKSRPDPFSLETPEQQYDTKASNDRIFQTTGGLFQPVFVPKAQTIIVDKVEPQPFRRLAGVLVGDSVMAIIDMGDNSPMQVIRPGMQIPNSPWKVISIDEDKAVLRRSGNVRPKEVIVHLQGPSFGTIQNPGQSGQQAPGQTLPTAPGRFGNGGGKGGGGLGGVN